MMKKEAMDLTLQKVLKRFGVTDPEELKKQLEFKAVLIFGVTFRPWSCIQIVSDIVSTKDGRVFGPKRSAKDP